MLGEHNNVVAEEWDTSKVAHNLVYSRVPADSPPVLSKHAKPFALSGVRVIDLGWMLASAGSSRFLAAMGAEVVKVEHISRLDGMRFTPVVYPEGGRSARDSAAAPLPALEQKTVNQSGNFMEVNSGKLGLSLNLKDERGKEILESLIRDADFVIEGYSPGTMDRMGFGYERLKELNPRIIYVQQSGLGQQGSYGGAKAFGPTAQAFSGLTEMSGFPTPWPPAGIGFSYLDWFGAYNMATAMLAALYRRDITGQGCYIDASQVETGIYLSGTAILDYTVNGRPWSRYGNRSPYKPAAPHGVYRAAGTDRWVAIANFTQEQWRATIEVLGNPDWARDPKFATLDCRIENQEELDAVLNATTAGWDRWELMDALQAKGVPAGVAQDAQDRIDYDPQLKALGWQVELDQTENGTWPARDHPVRLSETPAYVGGLKDRHGPNYGEDTDDVLSRILGHTADEIAILRKENVV
jgi:crotonobetainyl-CoA:carnitine CoA-transferase CaiB-like acyl-CoA transferase